MLSPSPPWLDFETGAGETGKYYSLAFHSGLSSEIGVLTFVLQTELEYYILYIVKFISGGKTGDYKNWC